MFTKEQTFELVKDADKSTPEWTPTIGWAKCVKVWDGDTIHVVAPTSDNQVVRFIIRCLGYDTPEIRSSAKRKISDYERELAREAKDLLKNKILGKMVYVYNEKCERTWGRILANVSTEDEIDVGQYLMDHSLAVPYSGRGEKQDWDKWNK